MNITSSLFLDKEARFMIKLDLLQVLRTECNDEDKLRTIFKYKEVIALFSVYIINRKATLFHPRNQLVARVQSDPLGAALGGISRLHRCQVNNLLREQLIPNSPSINIKTQPRA